MTTKVLSSTLSNTIGTVTATPLYLQSNNTTAVTVDTSQNVAIGTTTANNGAKLSVTADASAVQVLGLRDSASTYANNDNYILFTNSAAATAGGITHPAVTSIGLWGNTDIRFFQGAGATEVMRIDSSGNLLVGTTSVNYAGNGFTLSSNSGTTKWLVGPVTSSPGQFYIASSGTTGVYLSSTSATSWTSNSDERLKTDLIPIENATTKVASLRSVTGRYKADPEGTSRAFLIAQDVQAVLPEAVSVSKISGSDDDTEYLGVAYTEIIPLLVAAIKELSVQVTALQSDNAALKAKVGI